MKLIKDLGAIYATNKSKNKRRHGIYECPSCQKHWRVNTVSVKSGHTSMCRSCASTQSATTHNESKTKLYKVWNGMKTRCTNKNRKEYSQYGGRGIEYSLEWEKYENFKTWALASGYTEGLTIDRIDNDKNYSANNCRWVSRAIQARNTSKIMSTNTTGYRGVSRNRHKFVANISVDNTLIYLGIFNTAIEASKVYDKYIDDNNLEHTKNEALNNKEISFD